MMSHPKILFFFKKLGSKLSCIEVRFTDRNSKPLDIEDRINIFSVIN